MRSLFLLSQHLIGLNHDRNGTDYFCYPVFGPGGMVIAEQIFTQNSDPTASKSFMTAGAKGNLSPVVLGPLPHATSIFPSESPHDAFAFADRSGLWKDPDTCFIATRGAANNKMLGGLPWPESNGRPPPDLFLLCQNDTTVGTDGLTANERWLKRVAPSLPFPYYPWNPPAPHKDFNDWTRAGVTETELVDELARIKKSHKPVQPAPTLSSWFQMEEHKDLPDIEPPQIIKGLLYRGQKLGITAGSKKFKSYLLLYLAYCLANGLPVLGFETRKSKVAIIDFELLRFSLRRRLSKIQQALGQAGHRGNFDNLRIIALRGKARKFLAELPSICDELRTAGFEVVIIDPVYKLLLGRDENSNALVAEILEKLTEFCMETDVSLIHVQHHSKGNQAAKEAIDRASGAGSFGRDADTIIDFVDHEQWTKADQIFSVSVIVREFPPIDDFVDRWNFPLLVRDTTGLDPDQLKPPRRPGRPKDGSKDEKIMAALHGAEDSGGLTVSRLQVATKIPETTLRRCLKQLLARGEIIFSVTDHTYQLSAQNAQKWKQTV